MEFLGIKYVGVDTYWVAFSAKVYLSAMNLHRVVIWSNMQF